MRKLRVWLRECFPHAVRTLSGVQFRFFRVRATADCPQYFYWRRMDIPASEAGAYSFSPGDSLAQCVQEARIEARYSAWRNLETSSD